MGATTRAAIYFGNNYGVDWTRFEYRYPIYKDYLSNHLKLK